MFGTRVPCVHCKWYNWECLCCGLNSGELGTRFELNFCTVDLILENFVPDLNYYSGKLDDKLCMPCGMN